MKLRLKSSLAPARVGAPNHHLIKNSYNRNMSSHHDDSYGRDFDRDREWNQGRSWDQGKEWQPYNDYGDRNQDWDRGKGRAQDSDRGRVRRREEEEYNEYGSREYEGYQGSGGKGYGGADESDWKRRKTDQDYVSLVPGFMLSGHLRLTCTPHSIKRVANMIQGTGLTSNTTTTGIIIEDVIKPKTDAAMSPANQVTMSSF